MKGKVNEETRLLHLAKDISKQLQTAFSENRVPLHLSYKREMKTGQHSDFFNSKPMIHEFTPSNQGVFKYPTKYTWGEIRSIHTLGSYWCPDYDNQVIMYHSVNDVMCYSVVCCDGEDNIRDAREVFDLFVYITEHSEVVSEDTGVMDFVLFGSLE